MKPHFVPVTCSLLIASAFSSASFAAPPREKELTNSIGMKLTAVAPGEFLMGASAEEIRERKEQITKRTADSANADEQSQASHALTESEGPPHRVTISQAFWLGTYEVTQGEFQAVMGFNPSAYSATGGRAKKAAGIDTRRYPVEKVSYDDAVEFCRQLSSLEAEVAAGRTYRLPTEAEWEYAYRAGTTTKWYWGDKIDKTNRAAIQYRNVLVNQTYITSPVGTLPPNPWGLCDMSGNVREWCADWYDAQAYTAAPTRDPTGPAAGTERILRGGTTYFFPPSQRSAARGKAAPGSAGTTTGFRVVCLVREVAPVTPVVAAPPETEAVLIQKGLVRHGTLLILADEAEFGRYVTTLERLRMACLNAGREVDDAKKQLARVAAVKASVLQARTDARNVMRYSETWREHRSGAIARNMADDALSMVDLSRADVESWLSDAEADFDEAVSRYAGQCRTLREKHDRLQAKQRELAADSTVKQAVAAAGSAAKTSYRLGGSASLSAALKKLEHEEFTLRQLQSKQAASK